MAKLGCISFSQWLASHSDPTFLFPVSEGFNLLHSLMSQHPWIVLSAAIVHSFISIIIIIILFFRISDEDEIRTHNLTIICQILYLPTKLITLIPHCQCMYASSSFLHACRDGIQMAVSYCHF